MYTICALKNPPLSFYDGDRVSEWAIKKPPKQDRVEESECHEVVCGPLSNTFVLWINIKPSNNSSLVWIFYDANMKL